MNGIPTISVQRLGELHRQQPVALIDVRTPVEFREAHVAGARNVPLDSLDPRAVIHQRNGGGEPVYLICQGGGRAASACRKLLDAGLADVVNVEGGTRAWLQAGLPVVHGTKALSLERQVRIAAGALVLIGAALGLFAHPYFIGLCACVGAGLLHAGITDNCAMGMVLARMPWNQVAPTTPSPDARCTT
jgi:rhodanese-related sulfurtransferase